MWEPYIQNQTSPDDPLRKRQQRPHRARPHPRAGILPEIEEAAKAAFAGRKKGIGGSASLTDILTARFQEIRQILNRSTRERGGRGIPGTFEAGTDIRREGFRERPEGY